MSAAASGSLSDFAETGRGVTASHPFNHCERHIGVDVPRRERAATATRGGPRPNPDEIRRARLRLKVRLARVRLGEERPFFVAHRRHTALEVRPELRTLIAD